MTKIDISLLTAEVAVVDRAINDICVLFKCSRHNLNVVGTISMPIFRCFNYACREDLSVSKEVSPCSFTVKHHELHDA